MGGAGLGCGVLWEAVQKAEFCCGGFQRQFKIQANLLNPVVSVILSVCCCISMHE